MGKQKDLFKDEELDITKIVDDSEEIVNIPLADIDNDAKADAHSIVDKLLNGQYNEEFLTEHPDLKTKVDIEREGLRTLIKMRKSNEQLHDVCIGAISKHSENASLYTSAAKLQSTILSIQDQMDKKVAAIQELFKNYQLSLEFPDDENVPEAPSTNVDITRGTKEYIKNLRANHEVVNMNDITNPDIKNLLAD